MELILFLIIVILVPTVIYNISTTGSKGRRGDSLRQQSGDPLKHKSNRCSICGMDYSFACSNGCVNKIQSSPNNENLNVCPNDHMKGRNDSRLTITDKSKFCPKCKNRENITTKVCSQCGFHFIEKQGKKHQVLNSPNHGSGIEHAGEEAWSDFMRTVSLSITPDTVCPIQISSRISSQPRYLQTLTLAVVKSDGQLIFPKEQIWFLNGPEVPSYLDLMLEFSPSADPQGEYSLQLDRLDKLITCILEHGAKPSFLTLHGKGFLPWLTKGAAKYNSHLERTFNHIRPLDVLDSNNRLKMQAGGLEIDMSAAEIMIEGMAQNVVDKYVAMQRLLPDYSVEDALCCSVKNEEGSLKIPVLNEAILLLYNRGINYSL